MNSEERKAMRGALSRIVGADHIEDTDDSCRLIPEHVPFSEKQWDELISDPFSSMDKIEGMAAELCASCFEELAEDLVNMPAVQALAGERDIFTYVTDYLNANCQIDPGTWINTPVRLNIGLEVDSWSDYTLNVTYPAYMWEDYEVEYKGYFHRSSIMWLTRRQGYTQADLRMAQHEVERAAEHRDPLESIPSQYLYSAAMEIWNEMSIFNQLGFFLRVPLKEVLLMLAMQDWGRRKKKWPGYILVSKDVRCGFYSTWSGACSLLGIRLEKDIKLPLNCVSLYPDGTEGRFHSLCDVHGDAKAWSRGTILHWGFPRQFRRDAAAYGFSALP